MPIGNLTSQIFSNIYLNELDCFVKHKLKVKGYLRYGDDFLLFESSKIKLEKMRKETIDFLSNELKLSINPKNDQIVKVRHGLKFLGIEIWPSGRRLIMRNRKRIEERLNLRNISSYYGLIKQHEVHQMKKWFDWEILNRFL
ncbi:RNA-directed DNA polymerase [Patescibacteria group bacterium]|nr:RNA-directed DNA polymerase [Patescibacteria group bacterium]